MVDTWLMRATARRFNCVLEVERQLVLRQVTLVMFRRVKSIARPQGATVPGGTVATENAARRSLFAALNRGKRCLSGH
jgi:hypothetical protein